MKSPSLSLGTARKTGHPLPSIYPSLTKHGIELRRGQVSLVAGQPNAGKSMFALNMALGMAKQGVRVLYLSADTDETTTITRTAALLSGREVRRVEEDLIGGNADEYRDALHQLGNHMAFCFDPSPTLDDVDMEMAAFEEKWGGEAEFVVVDSLYNVVAEHDNEFAGMRQIMSAMHHIARTTGAHVQVLHHTSENEGKPDLPPARKAIMGKVSQLPELILTCAISHQVGEFRVACVKNRSGQHDAKGENFLRLWTSGAKALITEEKYKIMGGLSF